MKKKFNGKKIAIITVADILIFAISLLTFAYFDHVRSWAPEEDVKPIQKPNFENDDSSGEGELYSEDDSSELPDTTSNDASSDESMDASNDVSSDASNDVSTDASTDISADASGDSSSENSTEDMSQDNSEDAPSEDASSEEIIHNSISTAGKVYADKFTNGEVVSTSTLFKSEFVHITLKEVIYKEQLYFVQDIYIKHIESLAVGFSGAKNPGSGHSSQIMEMVQCYEKLGYSIPAAINGDYCGLNRYGAIIRNGELFGSGIAEYDVCIVYKDGTMVIKPPKEFNAKEELAKGAWHVWDFGPSLLTESGEAINDFSHRSDIKNANPRTAIGYYDPGHYCFVVAGGRKKGSAYGVTLARLSGFMEHIGCNVAYNLDGGQSSVMTFGDSIVNEKYQGTGRDNSDMVFIWDFTE